MPPGLACRFTTAELATLRIIADEVRWRGRCDLYLDAIAGRAGVSRSTARNAIREAKRLRLIKVEAWKQAADWNGPNRVTITSPEWLAWLAHGRKETVKKLTTTDNQISNTAAFCRGERPERGYRKEPEARSLARAGP
jgi:hypothetical protein